jgi:hypothetical protein
VVKDGHVPTRSDRRDAPNICFVCGLNVADVGEERPWGEDGDNPSYDYCPCCGVEFGYQDSSLEGARAYRARWLEGGQRWYRPELQPAAWDAGAQLDQVPQRAR